MKELIVNVLSFLGFAWWVEITTTQPRCTYYFGPFASSKNADDAKGGYVEDLEQENAQGFNIIVKRCKPDKLTIDESEEAIEVEQVAFFSGQPS